MLQPGAACTAKTKRPSPGFPRRNLPRVSALQLQCPLLAGRDGGDVPAVGARNVVFPRRGEHGDEEQRELRGALFEVVMDKGTAVLAARRFARKCFLYRLEAKEKEHGRPFG